MIGLGDPVAVMGSATNVSGAFGLRVRVAPLGSRVSPPNSATNVKRSVVPFALESTS